MMEFQLNTNIGRRFNTGASYRLTKMYSFARERMGTSSRWFRYQIAFLSICMLIIIGVSMNDVYWSFKTQEVLLQTEQNPIGTWLIKVDHGDVALFMTLKMLGNLIVGFAIPALYLFRNRWGLLAAGVVAAFQIGLFAYLNFGHLLN